MAPFVQFPFVAFLALVGFSFLNVTMIVRDYYLIKNDRVTIVESRRAFDDFSFIHDAQVCMDFPKAFLALASDVSELSSIINRTWEAEVVENNLTEIEKALTKLLTLDFIEHLDSKAGRLPDYLRMKLSPFEFDGLKAQLDRVIENPRSWSMINDAWKTISRKLIQIRSFNPRIPSSSSLSGDEPQTSSKFAQLISAPDALATNNGTSDKVIRLTVTFPNEPNKRIKFETPATQPKHSTLASIGSDCAISISNLGVFDKKNFPPCSTTHKEEYACFDSINRRTIEKACDCRYFSNMANMESRFENMKESIRFCTSRVFELCRSKAEKDIAARIDEAKKYGSCEPCTKIRNVYQADIRHFDGPPHIFALKFQADDPDYVLYTDVPKLTVWHIVSEAGGALGMAIGFSLLGIVQWLASCYEIYRCDIRNRDGSCWNRIKLFCKCISHHFVRVTMTDRGEEHRAITESLADRVQALEAAQAGWRNANLHRMEKRKSA